ncbi:hypothetical protein M758_2G139000 [Ceratodon purpureus]|nr:hypothetical protein M758_2G139000 [Ceratodon purpureus]
MLVICILGYLLAGGYHISSGIPLSCFVSLSNDVVLCRWLGAVGVLSYRRRCISITLNLHRTGFPTIWT